MLVLGGGYLLVRKKKPKASKLPTPEYQSGMRIVSDDPTCSVIVSNEELFDSFVQGITMIEYGAYPPPPGQESQALVRVFTFAFPHCRWPPRPGWTIDFDDTRYDWGSLVAEFTTLTAGQRGGD